MNIRVTEIRRSAPRFACRLAAGLRDSDAGEILGASGVTRAEAGRYIAAAITESITAGGRVWSVRGEGEPLAVFGATPDSLTADSAAIWMLATDEADRRPLAFARWSRRCLGMVRQAFPGMAFYNYVPRDSARVTEWLRWLGAWFATDDLFRSLWTGDVFTRFVIDSEEKEGGAVCAR